MRSKIEWTEYDEAVLTELKREYVSADAKLMGLREALIQHQRRHDSRLIERVLGIPFWYDRKCELKTNDGPKVCKLPHKLPIYYDVHDILNGTPSELELAPLTKKGTPSKTTIYPVAITETDLRRIKLLAEDDL